MLGEHAREPYVLVDGPPDVVPVLGDASDRPERPLLPAAADADRRVGRLDALGLAVGLVEGVVGAGIGRPLLGQERDDDVARLVEAVHAVTDAEEVDPVGVRLVGVPPGAEAQLEAAVRDLIERGGHVGEDRGVPVRHAGHEHPHPQTGRRLGQRREGQPTLEAGPAAIAEDRLEVVEGPAGLEHLDLIGRPPHREHVVPRRRLR